MGPAIADGLIPELGVDMEGTGCAGGDVCNGCVALPPVKLGSLSGIADDGDVRVGGLLVEAGGEQAVVFEIADGGEQAGGDLPSRLQDGLEDLDLVGLRDLE